MDVKRMVKGVIKYVFNRKYRFIYRAAKGKYNQMNDEQYLKKMFRARMGHDLNLVSPETFNEKIQWLKLNDRNPLYTKLVDKYAVREYVKEVIGEEYLVPIVGGPWDSVDEIDFDKLPNQFVLKCTHDSGGLVVCKDKSMLEIKKVKTKLSRAMKRNYYLHMREWPYKDVKPRIIAEKLLVGSQEDINDYKMMCFNEKCKCSFVCSERYSDSGLKVTFFDTEWNVMPFERHYPKSEVPIERPRKYEEMIALAEKLARGIRFVRVDFYEIDGKVYFGEMTFYPGSGCEEFTPESWDYELGSWIDL